MYIPSLRSESISSLLTQNAFGFDHMNSTIPNHVFHETCEDIGEQTHMMNAKENTVLG